VKFCYKLLVYTNSIVVSNAKISTDNGTQFILIVVFITSANNDWTVISGWLRKSGIYEYIQYKCDYSPLGVTTVSVNCDIVVMKRNASEMTRHICIFMVSSLATC